MVVILREVIEMDFTTLQKAMIDAMKARDKARKDSIAVLVSAAKKLAIDSGCREDIPDEMVDQAILIYQDYVEDSLHIVLCYFYNNKNNHYLCCFFCRIVLVLEYNTKYFR